MTERVPLVRTGVLGGYAEVTDPEPGKTYSAYREVCESTHCPFAWPPGTHSHIIDEQIKWPEEAA